MVDLGFRQMDLWSRPLSKSLVYTSVLHSSHVSGKRPQSLALLTGQTVLLTLHDSVLGIRYVGLLPCACKLIAKVGRRHGAELPLGGKFVRDQMEKVRELILYRSYASYSKE